jgi:hypothetical protein
MKKTISTLLLIVAVLSANAQDWNQVIKACASDRAAGDQFGISVAISVDYAIVGANTEDEDASGGETLANAGAAYIFKNIEGTWTHVQKIVASDRSISASFGGSVAISGNYAIVGAHYEDEDANGSATLASAGAAYIFKNIEGTWTQVNKIVASDRAATDYFGKAVAISGDYAIIGAHAEDEDANGGATLSSAGSAYIFKNIEGNWTQVNKVVASDRAANDFFGYSVAISGDFAIVGAMQEKEDANGNFTFTDAGSAYIFKNITGNWTQVQKIVASDRAAGDYFGISVAISSDYAIVGAEYEDHDENGGATLSSAGSAYVFKSNAGIWSQVQKIVASDRGINDTFGYSVAISNNYVIVGARTEDEDVSGGATLAETGSAYIFKNVTGVWTQVNKIVASDRGAGDWFGRSVAISGDYAIVGAMYEDEDTNGIATLANAGSAYIFKNSYPEINVTGNSVSIVTGDNTPELADHTHFGEVPVTGSLIRTYSIENNGTVDLEVSALTTGGTAASLFAVGDITLSAIIAPGGSSTFTVTYSPNAVATHNATVSITNNDADKNPYIFDISGAGIKQNQTITNFAAITNKTYGDDTFTVSATASSGFDVVFTCSNDEIATCSGINGTTISILKAGTCDIRANQVGNEYYNAADQVIQSLTVNTKAITVDVDAQSKIYGDPDPEFTYTYSSALIGTDNFSGSLTRIEGQAANSVYQIQQGSLALSTNYTLVYNPEDLTINRKPIVVKANANQNKVYGEADPATFTYETNVALVSGDSFTGELARETGENVDYYAIEQGTLTLSANYSLSFTGDEFAITAKPIVVTANANQNKVYGEADPATFTYETNVALISDDSFTGELARAAGENVGYYAIEQGTLALSPNYDLTFTLDEFEIMAKPITVTVNANQTKVYGEVDPATFSYETDVAMISGDSFTGELARAAGENVGYYAIEQGTLALSPNYDLLVSGADFEITKATPELTWSTPEDIYEGMALTSLQLNATANIDGEFSYNPDLGTILLVGNNQQLTTEFAPTDMLNYNIANESVFINVLESVGISNNSTNAISIYPNPTNGVINIGFTNGKILQITILSLTGKTLLKETKINQHKTIDLSDLNSGIYIVSIITDKEVFTKKIVKK